MENREAQVIVSGRVQGVWFRASTVEVAKTAGARGFVRNLPDRRVEAVIQGSHEQIEKVIEFMRVGPPGAFVKEIEISWRTPEKEYGRFRVVY